LAATKGWHRNYPGHSCKDIQDSTDSSKDGEYWIDPEDKGNPLKVHCDMTTDGGKLWKKPDIYRITSRNRMCVSLAVSLARLSEIIYYHLICNNEEATHAGIGPCHELLKDDIHYYVVCPRTKGQLWKTIFSVAMKGNF